MIVQPNCKINLGLNVIRKRMDGYHDIETVFYPSGLCDSIEITASEDSRSDSLPRDLKIPGDSSLNLCVRAYELIKGTFSDTCRQSPSSQGHTFGIRPGGGSSNAAFTLKALNEMFRLGLNNGQLKAFALRLGSDCSFFIENIPAFAKGRGEVLEKVSIDLSGFYLLIVIPQVFVSTADAYSMIQPARPESSLKEIITLPVSKWKGNMVNDLKMLFV